MTKEELKKLEDNLWDSANTLRATGGIKAADYAVPVLVSSFYVLLITSIV